MNVVVILIIFIVGTLYIGFTYENISGLRDRKRFGKTQGELIDVGGHRLHILVAGEREAGKAAIVLDAGVGTNLLDWQKVQPKIAEFAQVVSYDRAGYGLSEKGESPRTAERNAADLHTLLRNANIEPPYILVGHSFGGIYMRCFVGKFPDDSAGLVLVDSSHPEMILQRDNEREIRRLKMVHRLQRIGLVRLMLNRRFNRLDYLSGEAKDQYIAFNLMDTHNVLREAEPIFREGVDLPNSVTIPLTVISRAKDDELAMERRWSEYQEKLVELSPDAKHIHTRTSQHNIALVEPDTIVDAIREMYEKLN